MIGIIDFMFLRNCGCGFFRSRNQKLYIFKGEFDRNSICFDVSIRLLIDRKVTSCYWYWLISIIKLIFLPNYGLDFFCHRLNQGLHVCDKRFGWRIISFHPWFEILIVRRFENVLLILYHREIQTLFPLTTGAIYFIKFSIERFFICRWVFELKTIFFVLCVGIQVVRKCSTCFKFWLTSIIKLIFLHNRFDIFNQNAIRNSFFAEKDFIENSYTFILASWFWQSKNSKKC